MTNKIGKVYIAKSTIRNEEWECISRAIYKMLKQFNVDADIRITTEYMKTDDENQEEYLCIEAKRN